jgi:hypothetical protein
MQRNINIPDEEILCTIPPISSWEAIVSRGLKKDPKNATIL